MVDYMPGCILFLISTLQQSSFSNETLTGEDVNTKIGDSEVTRLLIGKIENLHHS